MIEPLTALYARIFSKPKFARINEILLSACLRARGYGNHRHDGESGEDFFISRILAPSKPRVCIDVGANVGNYTRKLLEQTDATVISFEPLPQAFAELEQVAAKFGARAIVENKGVGEKRDRLTIHYNPEALVFASFSKEVKKHPNLKNREELEADVVSLDDYLSEKGINCVDFIKIDTEGFESEVFAGAKNTLARLKPRYIQMEFNWHQLFRSKTLNDFFELLEGYDVYQLLPYGWVKRSPRDPRANMYIFSNFVFVRT